MNLYHDYELYYNNQLIGKIRLDLKTNLLTYKKVENNQSIFDFLNTDFSSNIENVPFIKSRIDNMNKFNLQNINYVTDNYLLKKIL